MVNGVYLLIPHVGFTTLHIIVFTTMDTTANKVTCKGRGGLHTVGALFGELWGALGSLRELEGADSAVGSEVGSALDHKCQRS